MLDIINMTSIMNFSLVWGLRKVKRLAFKLCFSVQFSGKLLENVNAHSLVKEFSQGM